MYYSVHAVVVTRTERNGMKGIKTEQLPTFFLREDVQGITNETHASAVARDMVGKLLNGRTDIESVYVTAYAQ